MKCFRETSAPIIPVLYSHFARMNGDKVRLGRAMGRVIKVIIAISIPIAFTVFSLSEPIGLFVFGEKWHGIGLVIGVMALMHGYSWINGMNGEAYRAMGKPALETIVTASTMGFYLVAYLISIRYGFEAFIWTRLGLTMGALILHFIILKKVLSLSLGPLVKFVLLVSLLAMSITQANELVIKNFILTEWQLVLIGGFMNAALLAVALFFIERKGVVAELAGMYRSRKA